MLTETDLVVIEARAETIEADADAAYAAALASGLSDYEAREEAWPSSSYASIATSDVLRLVAAVRALSGEVDRLESVIRVEQSFWETIADVPLALRLRDAARGASERLAAALAAPGAGGETTEEQP